MYYFSSGICVAGAILNAVHGNWVAVCFALSAAGFAAQLGRIYK